MSASECPFDEDTLAVVADRRARGGSWDAVCREVGWDEAALRRAVRAAPAFDRLYEAAAREVKQEAEAEALLVFRNRLRDEDKAVADKAAEAVVRAVAAERRDRTRLEVEKLRADATLAKVAAKAAKKPADAEAADAPVDMPAMGPEQVHTPDLEAVYARRAADTRAVVWLWGGAHKIGDVLPDPTTDVPLILFGDDTNQGRHLYWAARFPLEGDMFNGPFPVPGAGAPVPHLSAEQAEQLGAPAPAPVTTSA